MTFDTWLNAKILEAEKAEERALATLDRIEARRLQGRRIERVEWRGDRAYIGETHYFNDVSRQVWEHTIDGCQVAKKWLIDRKCQTLSFEDVLQYLRVLRMVQRSMCDHGCERCNKSGKTQTATTRQGAQPTQLCADCVQIVCRPGTNWVVKP